MKLRVSGEISVPGDKSITHRALMLAAVARGESRLRGMLPAEDCQSTARVLRGLGCAIPELPSDGGEIRIESGGMAAWRQPEQPLDCGNSGTTARLLLGVLSGCPFPATLTGDASLQRRPMRRVTEPLGVMGARFRELGDPDRLPIEIHGGALRGIAHASPQASAQVKSALLLAGVAGRVDVSVREPLRSRDHTERMLQAQGVALSCEREGGGWRVSLAPPEVPLPPLDLEVPGDPSAAAFFVALALMADAAELCIRGVCINRTRTGLLRALARMGGFVELHNERVVGCEPVADLLVRDAPLRGIDLDPAEVPAMIDELPVLAVLAARAWGETRIRGAGELRLKESDRIEALVANLRAVGAEAEALPDGLIVHGTPRPLMGRVQAHGDHRIAMAFAILAARPENRIEIDQLDISAVSFPGFREQLAGLVRTGPASADASLWSQRARIIVAIDGPAGSGKSTTARAVAEQLGYRHLDSGAFYRALTLAALRGGIPPERWEELGAEELWRLGVQGLPAAGGFRLTIAGRDVTHAMRSADVNAHVSRMAAMPAVRDWLLGALRRAGEGGGLVADGRDVGTVVFPQAELKVFLVCDPEERALRRLREQGVAEPTPEELQAEATRLLRRDALDSTREIAPLMRAPDAVLIDTTALPFEAQVRAIVRLARARIGG